MFYLQFKIFLSFFQYYLFLDKGECQNTFLANGV